MSAHGTGTPALSHYWSVLKRGLWIIVLTTGVVAATAVVLSLRQAALYETSADVFLGTQNLAFSLANVPQPYVDPVRSAQTQANIARVPAVAERAVRLANVPGRTAGELLGESSVTPSTDSDILTFAVTDREPEVAVRLANAYALAYRNYRRQLDTASLERARADVEQRLEELRAAKQRRSPLYADLAEKDQQLRTIEVLQDSNVLLARQATGAAQTQPTPVRNGILGGVLGFVLGIGLAFLRDALNTRVRASEEVEQRLGLPLLARIPPPARRRAKQLVMLEEPHSPAAESFRLLATNIDFVNLDRGARTIMITSARRAEGKSTTIANLAIASARGGRRVTLVDLDLRRPRIAEFFGLPPSPGLTDVVLGKSSLADALRHVPLPSPNGAGASGNGAVRELLEVLPAGTLPPNPGEFVGLGALRAVLDQLASRDDLVLIDAPPLLDLADTVALSGKVDALVVVTRLDDLRRPVINEMRRVLASAPVVKLGFVVTGAKAEAGYGYGYGYGYGALETASRSEEHVR